MGCMFLSWHNYVQWLRPLRVGQLHVFRTSSFSKKLTCTRMGLLLIGGCQRVALHVVHAASEQEFALAGCMLLAWHNYVQLSRPSRVGQH